MRNISMKWLVLAIATLTTLPLLVLIVVGGAMVASMQDSVGSAEALSSASLALREARQHTARSWRTDKHRYAQQPQQADSRLGQINAYLDTVSEKTPAYRNEVETLKRAIGESHRTGVASSSTPALGDTTRGVDGENYRDAALEAQFEGLIADLETRRHAQDGVTRQQIDTILELATGYALVSLFLILGGLFLVYRKIVPPLRELSRTTHDIAAGERDLTQRLQIHGKDEFAALAADINQLIERFQATLAQSNKHSNRLISACSGLSQTTGNTLKGMMTLHSETDQVATAITEMAATVEEIARNTEHAADSARQANDASHNGRAEVTQTIEAIQHLSQDVQQAAETIQKLEQRSDEIGTILDVIRNISEQTNLLALNAAIEAARAGESGRGFAVVADEVRLLAQRTQEATQKIQHMIEELQSEAQHAVQIMNAGTTRAEASVSQAGSAGVALEKIAASVATISDMNTQIATASEQQTTVANMINENIVKIAQVADATVGDAQQSTSASSELTMMADQLQLVLETYQLGDLETEEEQNSLIEWSDGLSVRIRSIDSQHRKLVDMVNELYTALGKRQAESVVKDILNRLLDYTANHFSDEEALMQKHGYTELEEHKVKHKELIDSALGLKGRLEAGDPSVMSELMFFLKDWLVDHIQRVDMAYSDFLIDKGVD